MHLSIALLLALLCVAFSSSSPVIGDASALEAIQGLWQGKVSFYEQTGDSDVCDSTVTTCDTSFAIYGNSLQLSYINCGDDPKPNVFQPDGSPATITAFAGKQLLVTLKSIPMCFTWAQSGPKVTISIDYGLNPAACTAPSTTAAACTNGGSNIYVYTLEQVDMSRVLGTWTGTGVSVSVDANKCVTHTCTTNITVNVASMVMTYTCEDGPGVDTLSTYSYTGSSFYGLEDGDLICATWNQQNKKTTMTVDGTGICPTAGPSCSNGKTTNGNAIQYTLTCTSGSCSTIKDTKQGPSVGKVIGIIIGVIIAIAVLAGLGWIMKKRHENSKRGSR